MTDCGVVMSRFVAMSRLFLARTNATWPSEAHESTAKDLAAGQLKFDINNRRPQRKRRRVGRPILSDGDSP